VTTKKKKSPPGKKYLVGNGEEWVVITARSSDLAVRKFLDEEWDLEIGEKLTLSVFLLSTGTQFQVTCPAKVEAL